MNRTGLAALLGFLLAAVPVAAAQTASNVRYVGSKACAACHADIYEHWRKTPMANIVRDPRTDPEAVLPDFSKPDPLRTFGLDQVALVYGSIWKQRYFAKRGNTYYVLPAQWDVAHRRWLPFFVENGADWWAPLFPPDNRQRPTGQLCDGCHSVDYDIRNGSVTEWNVGCERCHGPGSEHVAHPTAGNIINPATMDAIRGTDTCVQCHSQGRPLGPVNGRLYDWPVGYSVGLDLQDYWRLEDHQLGETNFYYFADGTAHKNRMQGNDFVQSVMYTRGITCFSCHDAHGTANPAQLRKPVATICLTCHGPGSPNGPHTRTIEAHTHHTAGTPGSECVSCHMPQIETQGVPGAFVHDHTFRIVTPAMTEKYKIPNPCMSCHQDKSDAWATAALRKWYSPWRME